MSGDLNPFAKVLLAANSPPVHETNRVKHTNNPVWESSTEFLCSDKQSSVVSVKIIDDRDFLKDPLIGYMSIRLEDLLEARKSARDWWPLNGCKSGRLRVSAEWKPLNMAGSLHGADMYVPPIGIVRLWVQKATDVKCVVSHCCFVAVNALSFRNVEAALGGKSDPYVRVQLKNVTMARTDVKNNSACSGYYTLIVQQTVFVRFEPRVGPDSLHPGSLSERSSAPRMHGLSALNQGSLARKR